MLDWFRFRAAEKRIRRIKRTKIDMERQALWNLKEQSFRDVIKAKDMESRAYQKALGTFVDLEEESLVQRKEVETGGDYHEIFLGIADEYAPKMLRGAVKSAIKKNKDKINRAGEEFIQARMTKLLEEKEASGEIKRVDRRVLEANK